VDDEAGVIALVDDETGLKPLIRDLVGRKAILAGLDRPFTVYFCSDALGIH